MDRKKLAFTMVVAAVLVVSSVFSSLPATVYAQENTGSEHTSSEQTENSVAKVGEIYYDHLLDAINASSDEYPAVMLKDINDSSKIFAIENKNAVLNTNGFTLEFVAKPYNSILLDRDQTLTINGSGNKDKPDLIVDELVNNPSEGSENNGVFLNDVYLKKASSNAYEALLTINGYGILRNCIIDFNPVNGAANDYQEAIFVDGNVEFHGNNKIIGDIELFLNGTETTYGTVEMVDGTIKKNISIPGDLEGCKGDLLSTVVLPNGWEWVDPNEILESSDDFMPFTEKKARYLIRDNYDYSDYEGYNKDGNYVDIDVQIMLSNRNEWIIEPDIKDWTYGEQANTPVGQSKYGTVEFSYKSENEDSYSTVIPSEPGNYLMRAYVDKCYVGHDEYKEMEVIIPFTINKITPAITLPENIVAFEGDKLSDVSLPGGFTWKDKNQIVDHSGAYDAIYTPDNTEHYKTLEVKIDIVMYDKPDTNNPNNDKGIPKTGDQTNAGLLISLSVISALGVVGLAVLKKKKVLENK